MKRIFFVALIVALVVLTGCTSKPLSVASTPTTETTAPTIATTQPPPEILTPAPETPTPTEVQKTDPVSTPPPNLTTTTPEPADVPKPTTPAITKSWREVAAPSNIAVEGAQWIEVDTPDGHVILAAVFYPQGTGPFPVVVWLHGTYGFQLSDVVMARDLAKFGFIGVAAGWFGGHYTGIEVVTPITPGADAIIWSNGPYILGSADYTLVDRIRSLASTMRTLPKARTNRFGLIGHSRGSAISIATAAMYPVDIQAVVALAGYPNVDFAGLRAPVLILHGTADQTVSVEQGRACETTLRNLGKTVESYYYEGAPHTFPQDPRWHDDMLQRATTFFTKYLLP
jgi:dienelactone hydrolase